VGPNALGFARSLIEKIVIHPRQGDDDPPGIELIGELMALLAEAGVEGAEPDARAQAPDPVLGLFVSSVKACPGAEPLAVLPFRRGNRMLILGLGSDLCDIRRVEKVMARFGERFLMRVFTETERGRAMRRTESLRAGTLAKRFAAKEACAKALGTGFAQGVFHSDMGVVNLPSGQPTLALTGGALARLEAMIPAGMAAEIALSLTDEVPYAFAQVIIWARPAGVRL
jgi:holo-[acyl-carrier protein] synthase